MEEKGIHELKGGIRKTGLGHLVAHHTYLKMFEENKAMTVTIGRHL